MYNKGKILTNEKLPVYYTSFLRPHLQPVGINKTYINSNNSNFNGFSFCIFLKYIHLPEECFP